MTQTAAPGRVQTLTKEQEKVLKQVWVHLFQFWGIDVDGSAVLTAKEPEPAAPSGKGRKLLGLFGKRKDATGAARKESNGKAAAKVYDAEKVEDSDAEKEKPTPQKVEGLEEMYELLKELDGAAVSKEFWSMLRCDYPDNLLLRFVRARKWDINKAMIMMAHSLRWRLNEGKPEDIVFGGERGAQKADKKGIVKQLELGKATVRGFDKNGCPIVYVRPRLHHAADQTEAETSEYSLLIIEQARLFLKEPCDTATILFDLSGFSMANMDYAPVKFLITCFEAHYPECLGKLFIHKAPWIFPPIWNIIKNWLDPVVAAKIAFTKTAADLEEFIPAEQIPLELGGKDEYNFDGFVMPDGSADTKLSDEKGKAAVLEEREAIIKRFIDATISWIESTSDEESAKWLEKKIDLSKELSENYSKLDPYIRSRSFYDVNGTLKV
ncbi:AER041Wp [Eremothecium gossypii ATCC 10895]|uniref:Phosphatidylinositol transfer protein CSR1 n=1 Tax=Eremothecium gossypii (strain ATCC 10895 / CBS 109.51 / FGSC 9923 / NRRL Y-1056) TaxID=284811 RepID=CSR1_EREGS|nr:AER041Wp [Eremothecium gossypii ATCC 10895]Q757H2.2 RecName: Full=Phosphatidylinositol transfer protein CSR1 [Eremothecium gossypii ATCC 10895]AAS52725.2 AER041Wp [Eremothecium gossypii ATCC 10895]AEY97031.1 FAER041Wp [Eremothecium gossypii FDAG1]